MVPKKAIDCISNQDWASQINYTISLAVSRRTSDVYYSLSNFSILSVTNFATPVPALIAPQDIFLALEVFFGNDISIPGTFDANATNTVSVDWLCF